MCQGVAFIQESDPPCVCWSLTRQAPKTNEHRSCLKEDQQQDGTFCTSLWRGAVFFGMGFFRASATRVDLLNDLISWHVLHLSIDYVLSKATINMESSNPRSINLNVMPAIPSSCLWFTCAGLDGALKGTRGSVIWFFGWIYKTWDSEMKDVKDEQFPVANLSILCWISCFCLGDEPFAYSCGWFNSFIHMLGSLGRSFKGSTFKAYGRHPAPRWRYEILERMWEFDLNMWYMLCVFDCICVFLCIIYYIHSWFSMYVNYI